jgi:SAM-dependent methyltransferase
LAGFVIEPSRSALRCPACRAPLPPISDTGTTCVECAAEYAVRNGIIDLLPVPSSSVERELRGLARENNVDLDGQSLDAVKYLWAGPIASTSELMDASRSEAVQYYQQTTAAYFEALGRAQLDSGLRVVEIGSERTHHFLRVIRDLCTEAYTLNIFYHLAAENESAEWPTRVIGDVNDLPFNDNYFDLVVCSATLHHSVTPEQALKEIARILRPGGRAIVVNEPIAGWLKWLGGSLGHGRDHEIHEDPASYRTWRRCVRESGLSADSFLPAWFVGQARRGADLPAGTRFRFLAQMLTPILRSPGVSDLFRQVFRIPGQALLGLPFNAVLWKDPLPQT